MSRPDHHRADGRFRNPWPESSRDEALRKRFGRVFREWITRPTPPRPEPGALPLGTPSPARPRAGEGELRVTWVGHATFLVQLPGLNVLTDPIWSERASPVPGLGVRRFVPAIPPLRELPPIDAVLLSHDHFDHLDHHTVVALRERCGEEVPWLTPLGYRRWFARRGVNRVVERDWWEEAELPGAAYSAVVTPARHWTRRTPRGTNARLWCSWALVPRGSGGAPRVYFGADSGYASFFREIGRRLGPFDASILPIGAYAPRWFMGAVHMTPEEAVQVYRDVGGRGAMVPSHWGTFRLSFEPPLEPADRVRAAWSVAGLPERDLRLLRHGETLTLGPRP